MQIYRGKRQKVKDRIWHAYHLMFLPIVLSWTLSSCLRCVESSASIFWHFPLIEVHSRPPIPCATPLPQTQKEIAKKFCRSANPTFYKYRTLPMEVLRRKKKIRTLKVTFILNCSGCLKSNGPLSRKWISQLKLY